MNVYPQVIKKNGRKEFVVLPYKEFLRIEKAVENLEDLKELRKAKKSAGKKRGIPLDEVMKKLNL